MNERPYQNKSRENIRKGWSQFSKQLLILPTGAGKTIVSAFITKEWVDSGKRVLFLAHREELLLQTIDKFSKAIGVIPQLEKAEHRASLSAQIVVGSVQTFLSRADRWPENHFDLVIVDECHHSISDSYQKVLTRFDKHSKVLGITATADRSDKRELGDYFENVAHEVPLFDLINSKFLCPISIKAVPLKISLSEVKQTAGDFDSRGLDSALAPYFDSIAEAIKLYAPGRKTLVFLPLIATSKSFTEVCIAHGLKARHIDGYSEDRREILAAFARREFELLNNAMLLTEGFDDPSIDCIVNLRPTRSRPLYAQIVGRGTRICDNKDGLLILDFLFQHEKHVLVRPANLIASSEEEAEEMMQVAYEKAESGGVSDELDLQALASDCRSKREQKLKEELARKANRASKFISAEEFALKHHHMEIAEYQPTMKWHEEMVTEKQSKYIEEAGIDPETVKGKGQASAILDVYFEQKGKLPASSKQKWVLRQSGWRSKDGLRGPDQATANDARDYFAARNKPKDEQPAEAPF